MGLGSKVLTECCFMLKFKTSKVAQNNFNNIEPDLGVEGIVLPYVTSAKGLDGVRRMAIFADVQCYLC